MPQKQSGSRSARQKPCKEAEPTSPSPPLGSPSIFFRMFTQSKYYKCGGKRELCYKCRLCNDSGAYVHGWMTEWGLIMHQSSSLKHLGMVEVFERYKKVVEEVTQGWKAKRAAEEKIWDAVGGSQHEVRVREGERPEPESLGTVRARVLEQLREMPKDDRLQTPEHLVDLVQKNPTPCTSYDRVAASPINWRLRQNAIKGLGWAEKVLQVGETFAQRIELGTKLGQRKTEPDASCEDIIEPSCGTGSDISGVGLVPRQPRPTSLSVILNPNSPPHRPLAMEVGTPDSESEQSERKEGSIVLDARNLANRLKPLDSNPGNDRGPHYKHTSSSSNSVLDLNPSSSPPPTTGFGQSFGQSCERSTSTLGSEPIPDPKVTSKAQVGGGGGGVKDYIGCIWCGQPNTPTRGDGICSRSSSMVSALLLCVRGPLVETGVV
ncbi:hypothetical protein FRC11_007857 [Ceratobasidium sp. 423]|nr:hypothetical protein FRC11_007857 [Ceratobasidium sp. 423]